MRLIGHIKTAPEAKLFGDFLLVSGIESSVEEDSPAGWGIWIAEEDKVDAARKTLDEFRQNPQAPRFREAARGAPEVRASKEKEQANWEKRVKNRQTLFRTGIGHGFGPLTLTLMVLSAIGYILYAVNAREVLGWLLISEHMGSSLPEVRHGQVWRLITPIFLHLGFLHILFNLLWLHDLGGAMEARLGWKYLALLVLILAVGSNLAQLFIGGSPGFGGMSGVVYGLLGYVWARGKFDPSSGFFLHQVTVIMMMIWFFAGFAGVIGHVANWAHTGGLVIGMAIGYLEAVRR